MLRDDVKSSQLLNLPGSSLEIMVKNQALLREKPKVKSQPLRPALVLGGVGWPAIKTQLFPK